MDDIADRLFHGQDYYLRNLHLAYAVDSRGQDAQGQARRLVAPGNSMTPIKKLGDRTWAVLASTTSLPAAPEEAKRTAILAATLDCPLLLTSNLRCESCWMDSRGLSLSDSSLDSLLISNSSRGRHPGDCMTGRRAGQLIALHHHTCVHLKPVES